jgi:predicted ATPase
MGIHSLHIKNYKSIKDSDKILFNRINVLIGANGAGKSNLISFFKFLNKLFLQELQLHIAQNGGADSFLFHGRKTSEYLEATITFDNDFRNEYNFSMVPNTANSLIFSEEWSNTSQGDLILDGSGHAETQLKAHTWFRTKFLRQGLNSLRIFHFHDTGFDSKMKQPSEVSDSVYLYEDGRNIASFLFMLKEVHLKSYNRILEVVQSVAPFFGDFILIPDQRHGVVHLRWREKGFDQILGANNLSDGTLRIICLATLLLQPELPDTIIIDEPELGLHPFAIRKLADLIQDIPQDKQILLSTQSITLINEFDPEDIIVVERNDLNESIFKRQSSELLNSWLNKYSLGEIWEKNIIGGRPK